MGLRLTTLAANPPSGIRYDLGRRTSAMSSPLRTPPSWSPRSRPVQDATAHLLPRTEESRAEPERAEEVDAAILQSLKDDGLYVFRDFLHLEGRIGRGHFGHVHRAVLYMPLPTLVAVKTLSEDPEEGRRKSTAAKFMAEGLVMREFDHPNVLGLVGISFHRSGLPMVITPYMSNGDLLTYVRDEDKVLTVQDLIEFGVQVARGMDYLSSKRFVHRDLAARNCLLDDALVVKIADFGLGRDVYERSYYQCQNLTSLPVRWMAPEYLQTFKYTVQSDVWSFGVLLWELVTRGAFPYIDVESWAILRYLTSGGRLPQPALCPDDAYALMLRCWDQDPDSRPRFAEVARTMDLFLRDDESILLPVELLPEASFATFLCPVSTRGPVAAAEESGPSKTIVNETLC